MNELLAFFTIIVVTVGLLFITWFTSKDDPKPKIYNNYNCSLCPETNMTFETYCNHVDSHNKGVRIYK